MAERETLYFSKMFLSGTLKGLVVHSLISYPKSDTNRNYWNQIYRKGTRGRDIFPRAKWEIVDASFQNYVRY